MKSIIILGTGGNCIDILDTLNSINDFQQKKIYDCLGFLDDDTSKWGNDIGRVKVLGPLSSAVDYKDAYFVNGIGSPGNFWKKKQIIAKTGLPLERFEKIIHPTASVSKMSSLGFGTVIFQNVTITSNAQVGPHVIVLPGTVISHDVVVGDYSCIAGCACISGGVKVGMSCYLGANCSIIGGIEIGDCSLIGMGSVVLENVPPNSVVVGNPARILRTILDKN